MPDTASHTRAISYYWPQQPGPGLGPLARRTASKLRTAQSNCEAIGLGAPMAPQTPAQDLPISAVQIGPSQIAHGSSAGL